MKLQQTHGIELCKEEMLIANETHILVILEESWFAKLELCKFHEQGMVAM